MFPDGADAEQLELALATERWAQAVAADARRGAARWSDAQHAFAAVVRRDSLPRATVRSALAAATTARLRVLALTGVATPPALAAAEVPVWERVWARVPAVATTPRATEAPILDLP